MISSDIPGCVAADDASVLQSLGDGDFDPGVLRRALGFRGAAQEVLFGLARRMREERFPSRHVEVRSVIEMSNICRQNCSYCAIGAISEENRYVVDRACFMRLGEYLHTWGRRVLLIQSGENAARAYIDHVAGCLEELRGRFPEIIPILFLGNLDRDRYAQLKAAGAERYILKFETSNAELYRALKPSDTLDQRLRCLETLLELGFGVGSGNMVGLPGQTIDDIVCDLLLLGRYPLSMSSCTVFIPGEDSALRDRPMGDIDLTLNTQALMRILHPARLIPATSSLEKARRGGQLQGLRAGANTVTIHDGTPEELKHLFPIYSSRRFAPNRDFLLSVVREADLEPARGALL